MNKMMLLVVSLAILSHLGLSLFPKLPTLRASQKKKLIAPKAMADLGSLDPYFLADSSKAVADIYLLVCAASHGNIFLRGRNDYNDTDGEAKGMILLFLYKQVELAFHLLFSIQ
jgi:hypothetical protein